MSYHIVQSPEWGEFKKAYGTRVETVSGLVFTLHKIPFSPYYFGYCPKVSFEQLQAIDWKLLRTKLEEISCIALKFDVPNILKRVFSGTEFMTSTEAATVVGVTDGVVADSAESAHVGFTDGSAQSRSAAELLSKYCSVSASDVFSQYSILLDITPSEDDILANMHTKTRYNVKYAQRKGVTVTRAKNQEDFDDFFALFKENAERDKYYIRPKAYYQLIWDKLHPTGICEIITTRYQNIPLASWMFFIYSNVLYYPYGGSSDKYKNVQASSLVAWEGIKLGKERGCHTFDMWGAAKDLNDKENSWWGFSNFKIKFGGKYVEYLDSYDFVINNSAYHLFNIANTIRWKVLRYLK